MRVTLDDQAFRLQPRGGVSRYFVELVRELRADPDLGVDVDVAVTWSQNAFLRAVEPSAPLSPPRRRFTPTGIHERATRPLALRRLVGADVVHHTWYWRSWQLVRPHRARVVTVHDMIPELFHDLVSGRNLHHAKRRFVEASDLVLCVSEATRQDMLELYGHHLEERTRVVHLGVQPHRSAPRPVWAPDDYVLYVGQRGGYKSAATLLHALGLLASRGQPLRAVFAGGGCWEQGERDVLHRLGLTDVVLQRDVSDAELMGLYEHAAACVVTSHYEGFGLPLLEAMAAGCPVVSAGTPAAREVGGDAFLSFPPGDAEALVERLDEALQDDVAHRLRALGRDRAAQLTWHETASRTAAAYRAL